MIKYIISGVITLQIVLSGCAPTRNWISQPASQMLSNKYYDAKFEPQKDGQNYFNAFRLEITNKTGKDLTIDWNKSRYLYNNKAYGTFVFGGVNEKNVHDLPPDIVPASGTLTKVISPLNMVAWKPLKTPHYDTPGFSRGLIPEGDNGIFLVVRQDEQEIQGKITLTIFANTE